VTPTGSGGRDELEFESVLRAITGFVTAAAVLTAFVAPAAWGRHVVAAPVPLPVSPAAETLYRRGILPDGSPLRGERDGADAVVGAAAACSNCHRRSGLGMIEGRTVVPPISGRNLFRIGGGRDAEMAMPHPEATSPNRAAYTEASLARALREGVNPEGRRFAFLMPRYALDDTTMALLTVYLKRLSRSPSPGVGTDTLQFATIITPDADPTRRQAMLNVLEQYFGRDNVFYHGELQPLQPLRHGHSLTRPRWQLHVWTLTGEPASWEEQLQERLRREPVFAVISGIGGATWAPVHHFCESESIPCLLPNVDLPVVAEQDFYPIYYSKGVLLEAELIARALADLPATERARRLVQLYRPGDIGVEAAADLQALASSAGLTTLNKPLPAGTALAIAAALKDTGANDAIVLWLRPAELAQLRGAPPDGAAVFLSGIMGGLEHAPLPAAWRGASRMTFPYELPDRRATLLNYPMGWFHLHNVPILEERTQVNTYIACSVMVDTFGQMLDNFVRDYFVERLEAMLDTRLIAGYYTRLGLAPGQRFASKGGYLVRFTDPAGIQIAPTTDWVVP
jgi:hypothetical protein